MWLRLPVCPFDLGMLVFLCPKPGSDRRRHEKAKEEEMPMENKNPSPAAPQPLPWDDDRVEAVRKDAAAFDEEAMQ